MRERQVRPVTHVGSTAGRGLKQFFAEEVTGPLGADFTIGAANGHGNARSVATVQAAISNGGRVGDTQLLSSGTVARIFERQSNGVDLVLGLPVSFGLGGAAVDPRLTSRVTRAGDRPQE